MILSSVEFPMMPSTNTRQDTTVLIYLKVSLISMDFSHGGGERGRALAVLPPLGICGGAEVSGTLALASRGQETSVGGVMISPGPGSGRVAPVGGNPLSSPWTPATPQAMISASRARPLKLGSTRMLLSAPAGVGWPLCCFESGEQQGKKDRTLGSATPATPLQTASAERSRAATIRRKCNSSLRASGELARVTLLSRSTVLPDPAFPVLFSPLRSPGG